MTEQNGTSGQNSKGPDWKTLYEEVCRQYDGIAQFRAKLLGFLPLASGTAGIFLLLFDSDKLNAAMPHLIVVGAFGLLTTFGLFWYELRGIQNCNVLIKCGKELESGSQGKGAFSVRQEGVPFTIWRKPNGSSKMIAAVDGATTPKPDKSQSNVTVGVVGATLIIYPTVVGGWFYITLLGIMSLPTATATSVPLRAFIAFMLSAVVTIWCMRWGWKNVQQQKAQL